MGLRRRREKERGPPRDQLKGIPNVARKEIPEEPIDGENEVCVSRRAEDMI